MSRKILFIELFQPFAQYRNPFTFYYAQTFPLPPKSTIIGMLQNALDDWYGNKYNDSWDDLRISIHGEFESIFWNYQNLIKGYPLFSAGRLIDECSRQIYNEGLRSQRSPVYQEELFNGRLFIFLDGKEKLVSELHKALEQPKKVLMLGRSEDIVFIRRVMLIDDRSIEKKTIEGDIKIPYSTYIIEEKFPIKNKRYPIFYIPTSVKFLNNGQPIKYKSEIKKSDKCSTKRTVDFKSVIYTAREYSLLLDDNSKIEVELYKIDGLDNINGELLIICEWGWI